MTGNVAFFCDIDEFGYDVGEFDHDYLFKQKDIIGRVYSALNQNFQQIDPECDWVGIKYNNGAIVEINLGKCLATNKLIINIFIRCLSIFSNLFFCTDLYPTIGKNLDGSIYNKIGELHEIK